MVRGVGGGGVGTSGGVGGTGRLGGRRADAVSVAVRPDDPEVARHRPEVDDRRALADDQRALAGPAFGRVRQVALQVAGHVWAATRMPFRVVTIASPLTVAIACGPSPSSLVSFRSPLVEP